MPYVHKFLTRWGIFVGIGGLFLLLTNFVYIQGYRQATDKVYTGINVAASADKLVYYSMIEQGRQGAVWMKNLHTSEPQTGSLFSPHWWLIGQVGQLTGLSTAASYHLARLVLTVVFLWLLWLWIRRLWQKSWQQTLAFVVVLFSSGFGWWYVWLNPKVVSDPGRLFTTLPVDLYVTELLPFTNTVQSPLFILSHVLLVAILYCLVAWKSTFSFARELVIGVLSAVLIMIHPYDAGILIPLVAWWYLWQWSVNSSVVIRKFFFHFAWITLAVTATLLAVQGQEALSGWAEQNLVYSPQLIAYIAGFGLTCIFWLIGLWVWRGTENPWQRIIWFWSLLGWLLVYMPTLVNRRFSNAWGVAILLVAAHGLILVTKKIQPLILRWAVAIALIAIFISGNVFGLYFELKSQAQQQTDRRYYLDAPMQKILSTIRLQTDASSVFLTNDEVISWLIPAFTGRTVYIGHQHQTIRYLQKQQQADEFFSEGTGMDKENWLQQSGIDYILVQGDITWFNRAEFLQLVATEGSLHLYTVAWR